MKKTPNNQKRSQQSKDVLKLLETPVNYCPKGDLFASRPLRQPHKLSRCTAYLKTITEPSPDFHNDVYYKELLADRNKLATIYFIRNAIIFLIIILLSVVCKIISYTQSYTIDDKYANCFPLK